MVYSFAPQFKQGQYYERLLDQKFSDRFVITPATRNEERRGIDRRYQDCKTRRRFTVQYKGDKTAARTHNAFVETVSVDTLGIPGWVYTTQAQYLFYYIPGPENLYILTFAKLRGQLARWIALYPQRSVPNNGFNNTRYQTVGVLVPLVEFERHAIEATSL